MLVRLATVQPFVAYLEARNVDPEPSLHKFGLSSKDVRNPERLLHPDAIYGIVNDLAEAIEDPFFGVHVGEDIDFESWPVWSNYYGPSSNLFAAFTQMIRSAAPLSSSVVHRLEVGSVRCAYFVRRQILTGNAPAHVDGFALASKLRFFDRLDGEAWDPALVTFETGFPEAVPRDYRGVNIELSDPGSCHLHFPTAWLLRPFLGSACRHDQEDHSYEPPSLISAIGLVAPDLLAGGKRRSKECHRGPSWTFGRRHVGSVAELENDVCARNPNAAPAFSHVRRLRRQTNQSQTSHCAWVLRKLQVSPVSSNPTRAPRRVLFASARETR